MKTQLRESAKVLAPLLTILVLAVCGLHSAHGRAPTLKVNVMTFNIRLLTAEPDLRDWWFMRRGEVAGLVLRHDPDVVGMQEVYPSQAKDLAKRLPEYDWYGVPREDGAKMGEMCAVFYRRDRLEALDKGTFWLSPTPDRPGTLAWDAGCRRLVSWIKFRDRKSDQIFFVFNTHFDHMGKTARQESAKLLVQKIPAIAGDAPAVITGDFNCAPDSPPYAIITEFLQDAKLVTEAPPSGPDATSRNFTPGSQPKKRIDYLFATTGVRILDYAVIDDVYGKDRRPSDHMPVTSRVVLP